jgi:signal transduction histidine kinase
MTPWLHRGTLGGKRAALLAFLGIAGLMVGGLAWVTRAALKLEEEQSAARAQAELSDKLRLALWRLDSRLLTDLSKEAARPYSSFSAGSVLAQAGLVNDHTASQLFLLELKALPGLESPPWTGRRFLVANQADWHTPRSFAQAAQRLGLTVQDHSTTAERPISRGALIREVAIGQALGGLLARLDQDRSLAAAHDARRLPAGSADSAASVPNAPQQGIDRDAILRQNQAQMAQGLSNTAVQEGRQRGEKQVASIVGPFVPAWLTLDDKGLVFYRLVQLGDRSAREYAVLDWAKLQADMALEVRDLLPDVWFRPIPEGVAPSPERALTALPIEIDPDAIRPSTLVTGWTPLRIGLASAWAAALVALAAVGLGGWTLLQAAERRMRFVSAVTHELRTPLTTLRLYLDMLSGGMVEESKRAEYLQTLNAEADRLNRLVANVLDFSRLENQRPRLETSSILLSRLLEDIRLAWQEPCRRAHKELVIDNQLDDSAVICTDVRLVRHVLGNLIDNACQYSQGAADPRIWLRAETAGAWLTLEVEDHGKGVATSECRSVFRAFRRGNEVTTGGVGLGLALARRWANLLGGKLSLGRPKDTTGACFRLELPLGA